MTTLIFSLRKATLPELTPKHQLEISPCESQSSMEGKLKIKKEALDQWKEEGTKRKVEATTSTSCMQVCSVTSVVSSSL